MRTNEHGSPRQLLVVAEHDGATSLSGREHQAAISGAGLVPCFLTESDIDGSGPRKQMRMGEDIQKAQTEDASGMAALL